MECAIFGGMEGGATYSKFVLANAFGKILAWEDGPCTNHYLVGWETCLSTINSIIEKAKQKAEIPSQTKLSGLGLCMSGCEEEESNRKLELELLNNFPNLTKSCAVASDTVGSVLTASPKGGLVLIAGTGSNALLVNPDGTTVRCGGWGHILGDEGSGFWISQKAVKALFDEEDNFDTMSYSMERVKKLILDHFKVSDKFGVLEHCYVGFNKSSFAALCAKLAKAADEGDELCKHLFFEAGKALARHANAILPKMHESFLSYSGGLPIICVGSLFKSWHLLKEGFLTNISCELKEFTLLRLTVSPALGAATLGAKKSKMILPLALSGNATVLFHFNS